MDNQPNPDTTEPQSIFGGSSFPAEENQPAAEAPPTEVKPDESAPMQISSNLSEQQ